MPSDGWNRTPGRIWAKASQKKAALLKWEDRQPHWKIQSAAVGGSTDWKLVPLQYFISLVVPPMQFNLNMTQLGQAETKTVIHRYLSMLPTLCHFSVIFKTLIHADLR
jgi:hypothetical protein